MQRWGMSPPAAANRSEVGGPLPGLGADLLAVVARLNRLATQRIQMPLPAAQARLLATIEAQGKPGSATWPPSITARNQR